MLKTNKLKFTKRQSQDGGFLPLLIGVLGLLAAPILGSLFGKRLQIDRVPRGKGLQVDAQQRPYRRVPRVKKKLSQQTNVLCLFNLSVRFKCYNSV